MAHKGYFKPKNPDKYIGDKRNIIYRSSYELKLMAWCDSHPKVVKWSSEELAIPYVSPLDGSNHRYFPDFLIKILNEDDKLETWMIEVKPHYQTLAPTIKENAKNNKAYIKEVMEYGINQAKWLAAEEYCKHRKWKFKVFTEKELNIKF
jgi:hypothetical protein